MTKEVCRRGYLWTSIKTPPVRVRGQRGRAPASGSAPPPPPPPLAPSPAPRSIARQPPREGGAGAMRGAAAAAAVVVAVAAWGLPAAARTMLQVRARGGSGACALGWRGGPHVLEGGVGRRRDVGEAGRWAGRAPPAARGFGMSFVSGLRAHRLWRRVLSVSFSAICSLPPFRLAGHVN